MSAIIEPTSMKPSKKNDNTGNDSDSDLEVENETPDAWPRYFLVESVDPSRKIESLSPWAVSKWFEGVSKDIDSVKRLFKGGFLVHCNSEKASKQLRKRDKELFIDRPVRISPHRGLNTTKGVIRCRDLIGCTELDVKEGLKKQGVIDVHHVTFKRGGEVVPSGTFFLTFCLPVVPSFVMIGKYLRVKVDVFIPAPLRCFRCQTFGHSQTNCSRPAVCGSCGAASHEGSNCPSPPKCLNCKGSHGPSSRECPKYLVEKEILRIKTEKKISFGEARKEVEGSMPDQSKSLYSKILSGQVEKVDKAIQAKPSTREISIQTEVTWVQSEQPSLFANVQKGTQASVEVELPIVHFDATTLQSNEKLKSSVKPSLPAQLCHKKSATDSRNVKTSSKPSVPVSSLSGISSKDFAIPVKKLSELGAASRCPKRAGASATQSSKKTKPTSHSLKRGSNLPSDRLKKFERKIGFANLDADVLDVLMSDDGEEFDDPPTSEEVKTKVDSGLT